MTQLRPYQLEALAGIHREWSAGVQRTLVVMATGLGKTVLFARVAQLAVEQAYRVLVLAHRTELLTQAQRKLRDAGCWAEIEQAKRRAGLAPVVVASVQTLRGKRLESFAPDAFDVIIVDEAHHAVAAGYLAILEYFEGAYVLGVTATADRADGAALGKVFGSCAFSYELRAAIRDGWLAPIVARRIDVAGVDLSSVHTRAGDLASNELAEIMAEESALHGVAIPLLEQAGDRRTIVFAVSVEHAHKLAEVLDRYRPGCARALDADTHDHVRATTIAEFAAGAFQFMVNVGLFLEGFDDPGVSCIGMARPTKSRALFTQAVGRGTRLAPGKANVLVLDFAGNAGRHRLVGPADVLAGDAALADDVRAELEARLGAEQLELDALLDQVDDEVARRREERKATGVARYLATEIDPFLGDLPELDARKDASPDSATIAQREVLDRAGLKVPAELSHAEAARLVEALKLRREMGLCTYKQARLLRRMGGIDASTMSFGEAGRRIGELLGRGARPAQGDAA